MLTYTHVTRVGLGKATPDGKQQYKTLLTPSCSVPVTIDDVKSMLADPKWVAAVDVTINENGGDLKQKVKMPLICKLLCNSLGLGFNAAARQNDGVDPLKLASEVLAGDDADAKADALAAMAGGKATLKAWAEAYAEDHAE